ncbi:hypothetical protein [Stieleria varia]|nr:hypothetical protein [Stieleria varia]
MALMLCPTPLQSAENDRPEIALNVDGVSEAVAPKRAKRAKRQRRRARGQMRESVSTERSQRRSLKLTTDAGTPGQLHLDGSFELILGDNSSLRGEGRITIDVDQNDLQKLNSMVVDHVDWFTPIAHDTLDAVAALPKTIESTREILTLLSDPETQKNLRHAEQVLGLLRPLSASGITGAIPAGQKKSVE